jgi:hypothetical protein
MAPLARPKAGGFCRRQGVVQRDVLGIRGARGARRAAIDTRRRHGIPELAVGSLVSRQDARPARVVGNANQFQLSSVCGRQGSLGSSSGRGQFAGQHRHRTPILAFKSGPAVSFWILALNEIAPPPDFRAIEDRLVWFTDVVAKEKVSASASFPDSRTRTGVSVDPERLA